MRAATIASVARPSRRCVALSVGVAALLFAATGCGRSTPPATPKKIEGAAAVVSAAAPAVAPAVAAGEPAASASTYAAELAAIDAAITAIGARAAKSPGDWLVRERLADRFLERARLSGSYDDYAAAEAALAEAFAIAAPGAGPLMTRARLNFALHRNDRIEADLDAIAKKVTLSDRERAAVIGLRADLALQRGELAAAEEGFAAAAAIERTTTAVSRLALARWRGGDLEGADALYAEALAGADSPMNAAWTHLMRGLLDLERERLEAALAHYREGEARLSGWWLIDEHVAEALRELGQVEEARARYEEIVARTQNPEFMDALAEIAEERGDAATAARWYTAARAGHERLLARFPEAAAGHALEHFLARGDAPARALELAAMNYSQRPNPEAARLLAEAQAAAGAQAGRR